MKKLFLLFLFLLGVVWAISTFQGLATQGTYDSIVLDFREPIGTKAIEQEVQELAQQYGVDVDYNSEFSQSDHLFVLNGSPELLTQLRNSDLKDLTEFIEPNYIYAASRSPNDPDYGKQWNLKSINIEAAWERTRGQGITVAIIDTGISPVPDLQQTRLVPGYDFVNDQISANDDQGHGTHVAGTVAQSTNNNLGVAGIAYQAKLMPLKVLSQQGFGSTADIAEAIRFAADNNADVINMSLGGGGASQLMQEAIDYAHRRGVVIVAAAGNAGRNAAEYPARYSHVIGVSALDAVGNKAPYSNFGAKVDIAAPSGSLTAGKTNGGILQNTINPQTGGSMFAAFQGTSMAAPHVAGVAALVRSAGVQSPEQVEQILKQTAVPVDEDAANFYGAGKLNAAAAVNLAASQNFGWGWFWTWLRSGFTLGNRIWFDVGAIQWGPKLLMLAVTCGLAFLMRAQLPRPWNGALLMGLNWGSVGFFILQGLYVVDLPQWPLRFLGSSIAEIGSAFYGHHALNPITASVLIPLVLVALFLSHSKWKWFAIGSAMGVAGCLVVSTWFYPGLLWFAPIWGRGYLLVNALLCWTLASVAAKTANQ